MDDPFYAVYDEVKNKVKSLADNSNVIRNQNSNQFITNIAEEIKTLEITVNIVKENPNKFSGITIDEINHRNEILHQLTLQFYSIISNKDNESETISVNQEKMDNIYLEKINKGVHRLKNIGLEMNNELTEQNELISTIDQDCLKQEMVTKSLLGKLVEIQSKLKNKKQTVAIIVLTAIIMVTFLLFFVI